MLNALVIAFDETRSNCEVSPARILVMIALLPSKAELFNLARDPGEKEQAYGVARGRVGRARPDENPMLSPQKNQKGQVMPQGKFRTSLAVAAILIAVGDSAFAFPVTATPQIDLSIQLTRGGHGGRGGSHGGGYHGGHNAYHGGHNVYHGGHNVYRGGHNVYVGGWRRPYAWRPGGAIAAGAAIGFMTAATAAAVAASAAPAPGLCWYYTDTSRTVGFWDNCP